MYKYNVEITFNDGSLTLVECHRIRLGEKKLGMQTGDYGTRQSAWSYVYTHRIKEFYVTRNY